jgi:hypothetical protein
MRRGPLDKAADQPADQAGLPQSRPSQPRKPRTEKPPARSQSELAAALEKSGFRIKK